MEAVLREGAEVVEGAPDPDAWVAARGPALLRLAYALTGNRADAEDVVQEALARGAEGAPAGPGLAAGARRRARQRRRRALAGGAVAVVLAVGVPVAVVGAQGEDRAVAPAQQERTDYRWESWHDVTVAVPADWRNGSRCAPAAQPVVVRPGLVAATACLTAPYGVDFAPLPDGVDEVDWPVAGQHSDAWPDGAYVGARTIADVVVTVVARTHEEADTVLGSATRIRDLDPNGCSPDEGLGRATGGTVTVCRYDAAGVLEQSERLTGADAEAAERAVLDAPAGDLDCQGSSWPQPTVHLSGTDLAVRVRLDGSCSVVEGAGATRVATPDVLYWALSPGFTGETSGLPLPAELRQQ